MYNCLDYDMYVCIHVYCIIIIHYNVVHGKYADIIPEMHVC